MPFDAYTFYYVGQALYQVNGDYWKESYPKLRDYLVTSQAVSMNEPAKKRLVARSRRSRRRTGRRQGRGSLRHQRRLFHPCDPKPLSPDPARRKNRKLPQQDGGVQSVTTMSFLPALTAWQFAAAGALCALGPVIIHLLNRRRFRVVQWAAMDFLREAMQRNRRIMQLRDILLLLLRTAAVLLFGLALARPFFASSSETFDDRQPLHAIIVVDNSLSMGYESLDGNLARPRERSRSPAY